MKIFNLLTDRGPLVVSLAPGSTVLDAVERMVEARCGSVLVTGENGEALGIFTERDLLVRVVSAGKDPRATLLEEVMTRDLYTTNVDRKAIRTPAYKIHQHFRRFLENVSLAELITENGSTDPASQVDVLTKEHKLTALTELSA